MTAKEILDRNITFNIDLQSVEEVTTAMKEYARIKCKEQRMQCAKIWAKGGYKNTTDEAHAIITAPEPPLE